MTRNERRLMKKVDEKRKKVQEKLGISLRPVDEKHLVESDVPENEYGDLLKMLDKVLDNPKQHLENKEEEIEMYFHCENCSKDKPYEVSPMEWARLNFGKTPTGFQLWCVRCDMEVLKFDSPEFVKSVESSGMDCCNNPHCPSHSN